MNHKREKRPCLVFSATQSRFWLMRGRFGDVVFRGVVGTLGLATAGSLVWFSLTGFNIVRETNRNLKAKAGDAGNEAGGASQR